MTVTPAHDDAHDEWAVAYGPKGTAPLRVLLYSDHHQTREAVRLAVGRRVAKDLPEVEWVEAATHLAAEEVAKSGQVDLLVLDGEAGKSGGLGLCRQLKDEVFECPPVMVLIARPADAWLASWSGAESVVTLPVDPVGVHEEVERLLRSRVAAG